MAVQNEYQVNKLLMCLCISLKVNRSDIRERTKSSIHNVQSALKSAKKSNLKWGILLQALFIE
jgi:hypothetical protein